MMSQPVIMAARRLADVLEQENAALRMMDLRRAAALLAEKTSAVAELSAFGQSVPEPVDQALASATQKLSDLVVENRGLLKRAITAQQRVIGIIVRAAAAANAMPSYGASRVRMTGPMALSTRA